MKVKKKLITFDDSWPWILFSGLACTILLLASLFGVHDPGFYSKMAITAVACVLMVGAAIYRYILRWRSISVWNNAYQTFQGTAVIYERGIPALVASGQIDMVIQDACVFWNKYRNPSDIQLARLQVAFKGATISVVSKPVEVNFIGKVMGLQDGQSIVVVYDGQKVSTDTQFLALIRHEVSHLCLTVIGIDPGYAGAAHHEIMRETGYC